MTFDDLHKEIVGAQFRRDNTMLVYRRPDGMRNFHHSMAGEYLRTSSNTVASPSIAAANTTTRPAASIPHVKAVFSGSGKSPENTAFAAGAAITGAAMVLVIAVLVVPVVAIM